MPLGPALKTNRSMIRNRQEKLRGLDEPCPLLEFVGTGLIIVGAVCAAGAFGLIEARDAGWIR